MVWRRQVLAAGWGADPPRFDGLRVRPVPLDGVGQVIAAAPAGAVLALGDEALMRADPRRLKDEARFPFCIALASPQGVPVEVIVRWAKARAVEMVSWDRLADRVRRAAAVPVRLEVPEEAWVPRGLTGAAREAVLVIPSLRRLRVEDWVHALGAERNDLIRVFADAEGLPLREFLWRHVRAVVEKERAQGWTEKDVAQSLGIEDPHNLRRKFRDRGLAIPSPIGESKLTPVPQE